MFWWGRVWGDKSREGRREGGREGRGGRVDVKEVGVVLRVAPHQKYKLINLSTQEPKRPGF